MTSVPATLKKYSALLLPNVALLSDRQCAQLRDYAASGGSLLATFETSRYNEWGTRRNGLGLGDVFGVETAGDVAGREDNSHYVRIESPHAILKGFDDTRVLPGASIVRP